MDFNKALEALNQASESFTVDAWIPSLQRDVTFKQLDAKQQKDLLGSVMDTSIYNTSFVKAFYNILKNNSLTENIDVDKFTLIDKISVGLSLKNEISDEIIVFFDNKKEISKKFKIKPIIDSLKTYIQPEPVILESKNDLYSIKVEVLYPTVKAEYDYDTQYKGNKKTEDVKSTEDVQNIVADAFIGETSKYINNFWLNDNEINSNSLTVNQKIKLIEKFPSLLIQKVLEQISLWKENVDKILTVEHEGYKKVISVDSLIFFN